MTKMCLSCARRKLAGLGPQPCADCPLLNMDPRVEMRQRLASAIIAESQAVDEPRLGNLPVRHRAMGTDADEEKLARRAERSRQYRAEAMQ